MGLAEQLTALSEKKKTDVTPRYVELMHQTERTPEEMEELAAIVKELGLPPGVVNQHHEAIIDTNRLTSELVSDSEIAEAVNAYEAAADIAKAEIIEALTTFVDGATHVGALAEVLLKIPLGK